MQDIQSDINTHDVSLVLTYPLGSWPMYHLSIRQALNRYQCGSIVIYNLRRPFLSSRQLPPFKVLTSWLKVCTSLKLVGKVFFLFASVFLARSLTSKQSRIHALCRISYLGVTIGDQLASDYIRYSSKGRLEYEIRPLVKQLIFCSLLPTLISLLSCRFISLIDSKPVGVNLNVFCFIPHNTRLEQILRRYVYQLSNKLDVQGVFELSIDRKDLTSTFSRFSGPDDNVLYTRSIVPSPYLDDEYVLDSIAAIKNRLIPGGRHSSAHTANINPEFDIKPSTQELPRPPDFPTYSDRIIGFPLHQISDDQFIFGYDDLGDLSTYHDAVFQFCISKSLPLLVKPHPVAFSSRNKHKSQIEQNYLKSCILPYFGLEPNYLIEKQQSIIQSTLYPNLYLVPSRVSLVTFLSSYHNSLVLTKYGNIVIESIVMGLPFLVSKKSRYALFDFNNMSKYESEFELFDILDRYSSGALDLKQLVVSDSDLIRSLVSSSVHCNMTSHARVMDLAFEQHLHPTPPSLATSQEWVSAISQLGLDRYGSLEATANVSFLSHRLEDVIRPITTRPSL